MDIIVRCDGCQNEFEEIRTLEEDEELKTDLKSLYEIRAVLRLPSYSKILHRHYMTIHNYDPKKVNEECTRTETERICSFCGQNFQNEQLFINHALEEAHKSPSHRRFSCCSKCSKAYAYKKDLMRHVCSESSSFSKPTSFCDICGKTIITKIAAHKTFAHYCRYCAKIFSDRKTKLLHIKTAHPNEVNKEVCSLSHLKNYHAPEKENLRESYPYSCGVCSLKIKSLKLLESHKKLKHNPDVRTATCPFCDYRVPIRRKNDIYRYHIKRMHPEQKETWENYEKNLEAKVQCYLCSYSGSKRSNMPRHYTDVHGYDKDHEKKNISQSKDDPDGALCPECGEHFRNRHSLITHLLKIHTKSTGEQCLYCSFRYLDIDEHINSIHSEEKSESIQYCLKCIPKQSFASFEDLLRHTRSYHRKIFKTKTKRPSNPKSNRLCESCGKKIGSNVTMSRHRAECKKHYQQRELLVEDEEEIFEEGIGEAVVKSSSKRYVPVHLSGICPYCQYKFCDLLGHIRHGHIHEKETEELKSTCSLCKTKFNSIRELGEFENVVELREHRKDCGGRRGKKKVIAEPTRLPSTSVEYEGRGTVPCHICKKTFTLKTLLRRHYMGTHNYDPRLVNPDLLSSNIRGETCKECDQSFSNGHAVIKHYLDFHAVISGQICPYCDSKWSRRKFDELDAHVKKYHILEMQSPIQTCSTCKTNFTTYEELKSHRQLHEGGNRRISEFTDSSNTDPSLIVHSRVGAYSEIGNKGGVKCQLCNAFKIRKEHLKIHYMKHHGYDPKLTSVTENRKEEDDPLECPVCVELFPNNHILIKHLLKSHCTYTGLICPYCTGHFPERFVDLQSHVTAVHLDWLTGYNISNKCKVCQKTFSGYAELRDHVQNHGDAYRDPYGNPEAYKANRRLKIANKKKEDEEKRKEMQSHEDLMMDIEEARLVIDDTPIDSNNAPQGSPELFFDLMNNN
ncbi:KRAB [Lepeophtheirus salmonis]|uniref:KRAB n=1 Tax=Lepeophtheirus salmonis TaxID=72036 RepID=A0A7R8CCC0_LEPSM|nr:KRAB [Lepeophtheirus salmonis]CAF2767668.1 KRAB [Lepeophtheirus salmonis]